MKVTGAKGIEQALSYLVPQLNDTVSMARYSPSQLLLREVPRLPGEPILELLLQPLWEAMPNLNNLFNRDLGQREP